MSDYLWDKTGEAEEDVERLEELLGQLRFQPRTFEVPATLPFVPRRAPRAVSHYSWTRLAIAASLVLMALAGLWLVTSKRLTNNAPPQFANVPTKDVTTPQPTQPQQLAARTSTTNDAATATNGREKRQAVLIAAPRNMNRHPSRDQIAGGLKRPATLPRQLNERDVNAPHGEIATLTPQEKEAMEKFMLAMKVTSEKLNYAERQVATLNERSPRR